MINARTSRTKIGLVPDFGLPISCAVNALKQETYLSVFGKRVLVEGLVKRNGAGQVIHIDVDNLTLELRGDIVSVSELRGILKADSPTVAEFLKEQRGH